MKRNQAPTSLPQTQNPTEELWCLQTLQVPNLNHSTLYILCTFVRPPLCIVHCTCILYIQIMPVRNILGRPTALWDHCSDRFIVQIYFPHASHPATASECKKFANLCPYIKIKKEMHSLRSYRGAYIVIIKPLHMLTGNESSDINIWMLVMPTPQFDYHLTQP